MNVCGDYINMIEQMLPDICTVRDLVKAGIYRTAQGAAYARKTLHCPPFLRLSGRGVVYPRKGVIEWLHQNKVETLEPEDDVA